MFGNLIPQPAVCVASPGCFRLEGVSCISMPAGARHEAELLADILTAKTGREVHVRLDADNLPRSGVIVLLLEVQEETVNEAYSLRVTEDRVTLRAAAPCGLFLGVQTIRQLLDVPDSETPPASLPCLEISDLPRFGWRGMHLDCARHFMPKRFILKFLDLMARYKFNVFHWHLTDDQGWRLEILRYPRLTEISAWREETLVGHVDQTPHRFDGKRHGGYYTREDVKEIVAYAAARHIRVVPEIEMPGHTQAVLAAYPDLGCLPGPYSPRKIWGISEDVFCAGREKTFAFLKDVLGEVMEMFPGPYIHIGGDECPKTRWRDCPACRRRVQEEGLASVSELQSYFIKRVETFLNAHGRTLVGWGEILEGGLAPNAVVMPWRFPEDGVQAARAGHDVVFAPESHAYFDLYQSEDIQKEPLSIGGCLPLDKVYAYEPVPEGLPPECHRYILGAQGQLWTEYMPTPEHVEYMAFPRMIALSEVLWTTKGQRNYEEFLTRLTGHLPLLTRLGVCFRNPAQDQRGGVDNAKLRDGEVFA